MDCSGWFELIPLSRFDVAIPSDVQLLTRICVGGGLSFSVVV
jgi:hypothetical protein